MFAFVLLTAALLGQNESFGSFSARAFQLDGPNGGTTDKKTLVLMVMTTKSDYLAARAGKIVPRLKPADQTSPGERYIPAVADKPAQYLFVSQARKKAAMNAKAEAFMAAVKAAVAAGIKPADAAKIAKEGQPPIRDGDGEGELPAIPEAKEGPLPLLDPETMKLGDSGEFRAPDGATNWRIIVRRIEDDNLMVQAAYTKKGQFGPEPFSGLIFRVSDIKTNGLVDNREVQLKGRYTVTGTMKIEDQTYFCVRSQKAKRQ